MAHKGIQSQRMESRHWSQSLGRSALGATAVLVVLFVCVAFFVGAERSHAADGVETSENSSVESKENNPEVSKAKSVGAPGKREVKPAATKTPVSVPGGDPRGVPDLVVCSQNLKLFASYASMRLAKESYSREQHDRKVKDLTARFMSVSCDVIAVQEVMAKNAIEGERALGELAAELRKKTNRMYQIVIAPPREGQMTNGFLIASDRATFLQSVPYAKVELPRISKKQRPRLFSRPPLEIQVSVRSRESEGAKIVSIVNFHFKSKRGAKDDPTGLEWETYRMEMSEALRQIVESRHRDAFASGESLLLLLGDRNSNFDVASARILEGSLVLSSFKENGPCRMSKRGLPLCHKETSFPRKLFSVITSNQTLQSFPGTFAYKGEYSWLDDILMPAESLRFAWRTAFSEGEFDSGVVSTPKDASDHSMVYVRLNW